MRPMEGPAPFVEASAQWRRRGGYLFGLRQAGAQGWLTLGPCEPARWRQLEQAFAALLGSQPPAGTADDAPARATRLLQWSAAVQRRCGLAVAEAVVAPVAVPQPDGRLRVEALIGLTHPDAAVRALAFVLEQANRAVTEGVGAALSPGAGHAAGGSAGTPAAATQPELQAAFDALHPRLAALAGPGRNTAMLQQAAWALDLPVQPLADNVLRLGWGSRQRSFFSTCSDRTAAIGLRLARDKATTARLLRSVGLPGAEHEAAASEDEALAVAHRLGWPVVVKPADLDGGDGVAADLCDEAALREAWRAARALSAQVLVERHVPGVGHRLTVLHGRVVKATAKLPWGVRGDGLQSVAQLVQADLAQRAAKAARDGTPMPTLDAEALGLLRQHGLAVDAVPAAGRFVTLRRRNNAQAGGSTRRLRAEELHPDNVQLALRAAEATRLDIAGIDLIVEDIGRSWTEQPALVCEVNAMPRTDAATIELLLRETLAGGDLRTPVWLLLMPDAAPPMPVEQARRIATRLGADSGASAGEAWVGGARWPVKAAAGAAAAVLARAAVLDSVRAHSVLLVMGMGELLREGLPVDRLSGCLAAADADALEALSAHARPGLGVVQVEPAWARSQPRRRAELERALGPHLAVAAAAASAPEATR